MVKNKKVLIAGMGKLGSALGVRLAKAGAEAAGIRRRADLIPSEVMAIRADLSDRKGLEKVKALSARWDAVVYAVAAGAFNEADYRQAYLDNLNNLLARAEVAAGGRIIFVSSSAVYGQDDGAWVDEDSRTAPSHFNGKIMLEAERAALQTGIATVVRFSGIYGARRTRLLEQVAAGTVAPLQPVIYSNRIHEEDCVGVLEFLLTDALAGRAPDDIYIASDCEPAPLAQVQRWIASRLGIDARQLEERASPRRAGSKRLSNRKLLRAGYRFRYPTYRDGYGQAAARRE